MTLLHIYAQGAWHDTAYILGTREGLEVLRDVINGALATGRAFSNEPVVNDGEGYRVQVNVVSESDMDLFGVPYTSEIAYEGPGAKWPWELR